jgi:hypothetical protein
MQVLEAPLVFRTGCSDMYYVCRRRSSIKRMRRGAGKRLNKLNNFLMGSGGSEERCNCSTSLRSQIWGGLAQRILRKYQPCPFFVLEVACTSTSSGIALRRHNDDEDCVDIYLALIETFIELVPFYHFAQFLFLYHTLHMTITTITINPAIA